MPGAYHLRHLSKFLHVSELQHFAYFNPVNGYDVLDMKCIQPVLFKKMVSAVSFFSGKFFCSFTDADYNSGLINRLNGKLIFVRAARRTWAVIGTL